MQSTFNNNLKKNELGFQGEEIACNHLITNGFSIIERNWRCRHKEIDIIARKDSLIVIVEVKTRSSFVFEKPQDAVHKNKQRFLITAANEFVSRFNIPIEVRFDIISIVIQNGTETIEHIENAFYPLV